MRVLCWLGWHKFSLSPNGYGPDEDDEWADWFWTCSRCHRKFWIV